MCRMNESRFGLIQENKLVKQRSIACSFSEDIDVRKSQKYWASKPLMNHTLSNVFHIAGTVINISVVLSLIV